MDEYVHRCAPIARKFSIGRSAAGRELWALEISNAPGTAEAEPNFKFVANMHGDEPSGRCAHAAGRERGCLQGLAKQQAGALGG